MILSTASIEHRLPPQTNVSTFLASTEKLDQPIAPCAYSGVKQSMKTPELPPPKRYVPEYLSTYCEIFACVKRSAVNR